MTKKAKTLPSNQNRLIPAGIIILLTTIIIQPIYIAIVRLTCSTFSYREDCGFELGIQLATFAMFLPALWFTIGAIVLIAGLIRRKKNQ